MVHEVAAAAAGDFTRTGGGGVEGAAVSDTKTFLTPKNNQKINRKHIIRVYFASTQAENVVVKLIFLYVPDKEKYCIFHWVFLSLLANQHLASCKNEE